MREGQGLDQTDRDRQTERHRETERETQRERNRKRERDTHTHTNTHTQFAYTRERILGPIPISTLVTQFCVLNYRPNHERTSEEKTPKKPNNTTVAMKRDLAEVSKEIMMLEDRDQTSHLNTRLPPPRPLPPRNPRRPPRSPSPMQPDPPGPRRTRPPPCPRPRTSARRRAWRTSGRTCGPDGPRPRRWRWCCSTCRRRAAPWPGHRQAPRWEAGS